MNQSKIEQTLTTTTTTTTTNKSNSNNNNKHTMSAAYVPDDGDTEVETVQLNARWTMWYDNSRLADPEKEWKDNLTNCGSFETIEEFWRVFNNLKPSSKLSVNSNYHVFREGVVPMWEDPENKDGGKFVLTIPKKDSKTGRCDEWWLYTVLAIIGETLDMDGDEVCGAVVSIRNKQDRIALWLKSADKDRCSKVGARWKKCLEMYRTPLRYQEHAAAAASGRSFRNESTFEV